MDAQLGHGGDGVGTDVEGRALGTGHPVLLHLHDGLHGLDEVLLGDAGDAEALVGVVHPAGVAVRAEELDLVLRGAVGLHALEALLGVVEHHGGGVQGQRPVGDDAGVVPALSLVIVHDEHVVGEDFAEAQLALVDGFGLGGRGFGDLDIQHCEHSPVLCIWGTGPLPGRARFSALNDYMLAARQSQAANGQKGERGGRLR